MPRTPAPLQLVLIVVSALSFCSGACDSKTRGEGRQPAESDSERVTDQSAADGPAPDHALPAPGDITSPSKNDLRAYTSDLEGSGTLIATIVTSEGNIECRLFEDQTPITVANFVGLARGEKLWVDPETDEVKRGEPFYDGLTFHRVISGFLIQGGDPTGTGDGGPGYTIPDEFTSEFTHEKPGALSMANRGPGTGGSQFFITMTAAPHLDGRHTLFGRCADSDVVEAIAGRPTGPNDRPKNPATIETIEFRRGAWEGPSTSDPGSTDAPDSGVESDAESADGGDANSKSEATERPK